VSVSPRFTFVAWPSVSPTSPPHGSPWTLARNHFHSLMKLSRVKSDDLETALSAIRDALKHTPENLPRVATPKRTEAPKKKSAKSAEKLKPIGTIKRKVGHPPKPGKMSDFIEEEDEDEGEEKGVEKSGSDSDDSESDSDDDDDDDDDDD